MLKAEGAAIDTIADKVGINRNSVLLCVGKYQTGGADNALYDAPGRGRNPEITDGEKARIINIACHKTFGLRPYDLGCQQEAWTYTQLTTYINKNAEKAGYARLSTISRSGINKILDKGLTSPQQYCNNRTVLAEHRR